MKLSAGWSGVQKAFYFARKYAFARFKRTAVQQIKKRNDRTMAHRKANHYYNPKREFKEEILMAFFNSAVDVLQTLVVALGAGLGIWGAINLLEGYGNDNRATRS